MKTFPTEAIIAKSGGLGATVFQNTSLKIAPRLQYWLSVDPSPFKLENALVSTQFRFDRISVDAKSWKQLAGRTFDFPVNPKDGYIDGSVYLFGVHNPADATVISFGQQVGKNLPADIMLAIDFAYEGHAEYGVVPLALESSLEIFPLRIDSEIREECGNDLGNVSGPISVASPGRIK